MTKGAIRAGIELLLKASTSDKSRIEKIVVAGAFGSFLDIRSAIAIGLLPNLPVSLFEQVGNAAGMGAKQTLLSRKKMSEATEIANNLKYLELAGHPGFTEAFTKAMMFKPDPFQ